MNWTTSKLWTSSSRDTTKGVEKQAAERQKVLPMHIPNKRLIFRIKNQKEQEKVRQANRKLGERLGQALHGRGYPNGQ